MESNNDLHVVTEDARLARACRYSRYAQRVITAQPDLARLPFDVPCSREQMLDALMREAPVDDASLGRALRLLRQEVMLRLIVRDLNGLADLQEVTHSMTTLAEVAITAALEHVDADLSRQYGAPRGPGGLRQQLHVVGMGKLGGGELNVSSDIDLILLYPEDGDTDGARPLTNHEFFTRVARRMIAALAELTEHGYVFRVDTRLRPYGDGGPLVMSYDMLENYLITQGREWERYAWIKGRALTGDRGDELMELVRPFVFRRHLDFSAFSSMRDLHDQVRREVARRDIADNIKLGPGGIREIEFIVQVFQLIRGGRDAALRAKPTLEVLAALLERRLLPQAAVAELEAAYVFLRNLEHRLQYADDQQTHRLPAHDDERLAIAQEMGYASYDEFAAQLETHRAHVSRHFSEIFTDAATAQHPLAALWQDAEAADTVVERLTALGFRRASDVQQRLVAMRRSGRYREMPAASQARLDRLVPLTIAAARGYGDPDATLERVLQLLESVSR
ncbi:MAG TPA: bifunctional [glutamate--ammonia ligase]-adenylyl-L-tyrosine phosphorylase/[glutamate--ammonia-ligase] adenylyltransferase, partial [Burkholderiales bacterium]|nr:bifunctional [glutamate--ammonia ligase]-adenylyl-L-tyrosine phosphorylase/[glutamate--ammonia-ligase] adenylyltransferase [Burkholderiales bacterium]